MRKKVKARLLENVYRIEIEKMREDGMSYKNIARTLSIRHRCHFSTGLVFKCFLNRQTLGNTNIDLVEFVVFLAKVLF